MLDEAHYTYGDATWGDLLTAYDGAAITYGEIGNPLYDGTWTYTWEHGRQLASMSDGTTTWTFTYDADGMRIGRTNGTDTYTYVYNGGLLTQMTKGDDTLFFTYDAMGAPATVTHNGTVYFYITNLQGDTLALIDEDGNVVVTYVLDAWGNIISISGTLANTLGVLNPLIYRGYVYNYETGLYYLQSRYYSPEVGRFINADGHTSTGQGILGCNMFAYCNNNPANQIDPLGTASYKNSYSIHKDSKGRIIGYNIVTIISVMWTKLTYRYYIKANGVIQFNFDENNYWGLLWRGASMTLAEAMYKQAKAINKEFLYGRTIGGLNTELQGHWAAYAVTGNKRAGTADMGALIKGKLGYDSNAWVWEGGNVAKICAQINYLRVGGYANIIRNLLRYI